MGCWVCEELFFVDIESGEFELMGRPGLDYVLT